MTSRDGTAGIAVYIRRHAPDIVEDWLRLVRHLPAARKLDEAALRDHVPHLLLRIAALIDELASGGSPELPTRTAERHALERLDEGFDLREVVLEYSLLRECILRRWELAQVALEAPGELVVLNQAVDRAIAASVERYTVARDRTLQALDRISYAALESKSLDELLQRLARVMVDTIAAIDTAVILMREGHLLRVHAAAGLDEGARGFSIRIGEGFVGRIAAERAPRAVEAASTDELVTLDALGTPGVRVLYGIPLVSGDDLIGVAHVGSSTAYELSDQDTRLVVAMGERATTAITQHMLRDAVAERERQQTAIAALGVRALATRDLQTVLDDAVSVVATTLRAEYAELLELLDGGLAMRLRAGVGWRDGLVGTAVVGTDLDSQAGYTLASSEPVIVEDLPTETRFSGPALLHEHGVASGLSVIIQARGPTGKAYGVLGAHTRSTRTFSTQDVAFLQSVANVVATAILRCRAEALLDEAEERFRLIVERVEDYAIFLLDPEGRVASWNIGAEHIKGYRAPEILGSHMSVFYPPEDVAAGKPRSLLERALAAGRAEDEGWRVRQDGAKFWADVSITALRDESGSLRGFAKVTRDLSHRKRADDERDQLVQELSAERARLEAVLAHMPAGVVIIEAPSGRVLLANQRVDEIWRRALGPAGTRHDYDSWVGFDPATGARLGSGDWAIARALTCGEPVLNQEVEIVRGDATRGVISNHAAPIRDPKGALVGAVAVFYDVTARIELERDRTRLLDELTRAEQAHRFLSEASKQLAESIDYEATLAKVTRLAVPRIADWCVADLLEGGAIRRVSITHGDPAKLAIAEELRRRYPPDADGPSGVATVLRTGQPACVANITDEVLARSATDPEHLEMLRQLGLRSYVSVPMIVHGRVVGALSMISAESGHTYTAYDVDVAYELARRAAMAIENARLHKEAREAVQTREHVLAVVSHDLRNPLGTIELAGSLLAQRFEAPEADERARRCVETIQRAISRMERMIGDLLDMASIQGGRLAFDQQRQDVAEVVTEGIDAMEPIARNDGISIRRELAAIPAHVRCDRGRIVQVLSNLLGNAIKYGRTGDTIVVRLEVTATDVIVAVADRGPGIPADEVPHVFDPYWTAKRAGKRGTGLGLYITKGIVEAHDGRVWVHSHVGTGSTFHFSLPRTS